MAGSVNKVILVGNLGQEPEIKSFGNGGRVANFSIATSESWKDKASGERKEKTEWHRIAVYNDNLVTVCEKYLHKGAKVYIEGQLETRKWQDKETGQDKYTTEIVLKQFRGELTMLDSRASGNGGGYNSDAAPAAESAAPQRASWQAPANSMDDDIPF